jgi:SAM-dependent methyltransferase
MTTSIGRFAPRRSESTSVRKAGSRRVNAINSATGFASRIAETRGASVIGTDINALAIKAAKTRSTPKSGHGCTEFITSDADNVLPFPNDSFDFVFCNDAVNHFRNRLEVLKEWKRVLRIGGKCLFTDPVVLTGLVSNAELAARSSIGFFIFSAPGVNERHLQGSGFHLERMADRTDSVVEVSGKWRAARERRRTDLVSVETEAKYEAIQAFLASVHLLARERRLSRFVYIGRRVENAV